MKSYLAGFALIAAAFATQASAQDLNVQEVVVTGSRVSLEQNEFDDYNSERPAVGLRRLADFLVQPVAIRGDTRDEEQRGREIRAMLNDAVRLARQHGVELAYGEYILTELTAANIDELTLDADNRPDSQRVTFLV
jgi:hypothetical protein